MATNPINSWDLRLLAVSETTFGTTPTPANVAAYAAQAREFTKVDLGGAENPVVRAKKDRAISRGMQTGWVQGRYQPLPFTLGTTLKSRSAVDAVPLEAVLYKAAGLKQTVNAATNVVIAPSPTPLETAADFASASFTRLLGTSPSTYFAETLRGCVVSQMTLEGGDKEVEATFSGQGVGKNTQGDLLSVTLASGVVTTLTHTAEESYRLDAGYYLIESEIILISSRTNIGYGSTSTTIARAQLGSTGVAHSAVPMQPYIPTGIAYTGSPISEATATVTIDGVAIPALNWKLDVKTGLMLRAAETGSAYVQGPKEVRYEANLSAKVQLKGTSDVSMLGKAVQRKNVAVSIVQGVGTGSIVTLAAANCEVIPPKVPDTANDIALVDIAFRIRDSGSNDMFTITLT